jgi:hypothetical protein
MLARAGGNLLNGVFRFLQIKKRLESLRLLHRVNVTSHQVLD